MATENWKTIESYPDYDVSDLGRVRRKETGYILKQQKVDTMNNRGESDVRNYVRLSPRGKKGKNVQVSRLVALAFIPNPDPVHKTIADHIIGGHKCDDRAINLRWATPSENCWNKKRHINNKSGYKGVAYKKALGKYTAQICYRGKQKHLGTFESAEEAYFAYCDAADELFGEFACFE